ncbi:MAG: carbamoyl phosphate synthase small subunit [Oscillospiraceae bacterium]|jgi:carbamoyl-phosphate synthase small subunit
MGDAAFLVLENGMVFRGQPLGAEGEALCEIVFATGMTGYMETLTNKSYYGQGVVQTFPLIGNYGSISEDEESQKPWLSAYIVRQCCDKPSNFRSEGTLDAYLKKHGVVGLQGIDTRALTRLIRENGVMNGMICRDPGKCDMDALRAYRVSSALPAVSVKEPVFYKGSENGPVIVLLDCGYKESILACLLERGCSVWVMPHDTPASEILAKKGRGILISNGPADPADNKLVIETISRLRQSGAIIFGICLGHQLLALAEGFKTAKMKYGHRGLNQAVRRETDGKVYITSQNHGYTVLSETVDPAKARLLFTNVNDGTCEGLEYLDGRAFSVQFHPEAGAGPLDTTFLFDEFLRRAEVQGKCR